ncbi:uncharacterized protein LOC129716629 [Wyeomyia smithii]|uniref:uncharacterized protein LOC129716629 n=1 Tax=Wyeomyia smithii TaxID=174621 RepID=UPI002467C49F|nr:uncharacterized protein LOC129716629 [Wyeomyia smithii]
MGATLKQTYDAFINDLDDLFDIARADALTIMHNKEDRDFLEKQRQKGRPGSMLGVDAVLTARENRSELSRRKEEARQKKEDDRLKNEKTSTRRKIDHNANEDTGSVSDAPEIYDGEIDAPISQERRFTRKQQWITPRLCSALDKAKVSDRDAMHILMAALEGLKLPSRDYTLNRTSLQRKREENRHNRIVEAKSDFIYNISTSDRLVVHWDGKILTDLVGRSHRIAVLFLSSIITERNGRS